MKKLPQINELVEQVKERVRSVEEEKVASTQQPEETREFTSDIAGGLHKLAAYLRKQASADVTYDDVRDFGRRILGE